MLPSMNGLLRSAALLTLAVLAGCGGAKRPGHPATLAPQQTTLPPEEIAVEYAGQLTAESDTLSATDLLLDSLGVPVDSLGSPGAFATDLPDLSDSLAALTEARLPSVEELFDYPVVINRRVLTWIDLYRGRAKNTFNRSLKRSGRYLAMARRIFAEEGVPQDLAFLAHVESGFRFNARSPARALGLWQFMRGTARIYGLRCDAYVDERLDPEKSTRAAARLLRDLHDNYQDWYLALAAYNAGSGKVNRAISRAGTRDFWQIARTRYLRNETRNFVPAILAATTLAKSPGAYGFDEEADRPLAYDKAVVDSPTDLRVVAQIIGKPVAEIQDLNPALLLNQTPSGVTEYEIRLPAGTGEQFAADFAKIPPENRLVFLRHKVRRGETLGLLAQRYGTTVRAIQDANRMGRRTMIVINQTLKIPTRSGLGWSEFDRAHAIKHTVRRGEYLGLLARNYGVSVREIQEANGLADPRLIVAGQELLIPPSKRVAASAEPAPAQDDLVEIAPADTLRGAEMEWLAMAGADQGSHPAVNTSDSLGRVPTTAHLVEQAREAIKREREEAVALGLPPEGPRIHTVRRGDTLSEIAARYGIRLSELRRWNDLGRGHLIRPGQDLVVADPANDSGGAPDGEEAKLHVVKRGESLWKIAKRYGVRVTDLADWNRLRRGALIYPGQKLRVY